MSLISLCPSRSGTGCVSCGDMPIQWETALSTASHTSQWYTYSHSTSRPYVTHQATRHNDKPRHPENRVVRVLLEVKVSRGHPVVLCSIIRPERLALDAAEQVSILTRSNFTVHPRQPALVEALRHFRSLPIRGAWQRHVTSRENRNECVYMCVCPVCTIQFLYVCV